jgi:hypothetical protein
MAITSVTEDPLKETGEQTASTRAYARGFIVKSDDPVADRSPEALAAIDPGFVGPEAPEDTDRIPRLGESMPGDAASTVRGRKAAPRGSDRSIWDVIVDYDSSTESENEDPTDDEPEISFSFTSYTRPVVDAFEVTDDGVPANPVTVVDTRFDPTVAVLASSKKPFNPPHVQEFGNLLISMRIKEDTIDPEDFRFFKDTINDRQITIADVLIEKLQGRIRNYATSGSKQFKPDGSGSYWVIAVDIEINARTWVSRFLDISFYRLNVSNEPILIRDENREEVVDPVLLDGEGGILPADDPPVFLPYYTYFPANWSTILVTLPSGL